MGGIIVAVLVLLVLYIVLSGVVNILFSLIVPILIWALIGWSAGKLMRGAGYGALGNILLGVGGGIVGSILFRLLNLGGIGDIWFVGNIIVGVVGGVVILFVARALNRA